MHTLKKLEKKAEVTKVISLVENGSVYPFQLL